MSSIPTIPSVPSIAYASHIPAGGFGPGLAAGGGGGIASLQDAAFYYKLDTNSWLDSTASANNLADTVVAGTCAAAKVGNGFIGTGPGNTVGLYHADATPFNMQSTDFTLSCWVNFATLDSTNQNLIAKFNGTHNEYLLQYSGADGKLRMRVFGTSNLLLLHTLAVSTGVWYFVEAGYDSVNHLVFINVNNGTEVTGALTSTVNHFTDNAFTVACQTDGSFNGLTSLGGIIDEVGGWKRRWTSLERTAIYNVGAGASVF